MKHLWVIRLAREDASAIALLRLSAGVQVAETERDVWLRGPAAEDLLTTKIAALPGVARYELLPTNQLRRVDQIVPAERLGDFNWQPIATWAQVELPVSASPAFEPRSIPLRLVRSHSEREPQLLRTSLGDFAQFAANTALIRLQRLTFAANAMGEVLVRGTPLPPLPGDRFVLRGPSAVPAGFSWEPFVSEEVLARVFGASGDALVLWNQDGTITRLHSEQFVACTRSAIRATQAALSTP